MENKKITPDIKNKNTHFDEESLRNIVEWAEEGVGQHNFLRITSDLISPEVKELLTSHGYTLCIFNDPYNHDERIELETLIVNAQTYMNFSEKKKVAVIVSNFMVQELLKDTQFRGNWSLNAMYMETL